MRFRAKDVLRSGGLVAVALLVGPVPADATEYCENISGNTIVVGEARYATTQGDDECYANAFSDGGEELSLGVGSPIGGANSASTSLGFWAYVFSSDNHLSDCSTVTYTVTHRRSSTQSGGCPSNYTTVADPLIVDQCTFGDGDKYWVGKLLGRSSQSYQRYWYWEVKVDTTSGCSDSDNGCAEVKNQNDCTLEDFPI